MSATFDKREGARPAPPSAQVGASVAKSPVLVKYNYYDWNGRRQDNRNNMMVNNNNNINNNNINEVNINTNTKNPQEAPTNPLQMTTNDKPVQRQLSPQFKQSLDQIVRNSQQLLLGMNSESLESSTSASGSGSGSVSASASATPSPEFNADHFGSDHHQVAQPRVPNLNLRRYKACSYEQRCVRCRKQVYQMDKVGPLKELSFFHQNCFKCFECKSKLTLKTYFNNQQASGDLEVYCHRHCPKTGPGKLDGQSVGIRCALNAPKVGVAPMPWSLSHDLPSSYGAYPVMTSVSASGSGSPDSPTGQHHRVGSPLGHPGPAVDSQAMHIQHAVQQTRLHEAYRQQQQHQQQLVAAYHSGSSSANTERLAKLINLRLEYLEPRQKRLEMRHREEEDALFRVFEQKWRHEESTITEQVRHEWQRELAKLLERYKQQLSSISTTAPSKANARGGLSKPKEPLVAPTTAVVPEASQQDLSRIERERMDLEATMTIKLDRKRETLKRKLKEFERQATAELVEKQSHEMLTLISKKLDEFKQEQKRKIGTDLEQFEAIELLANQFDNSMRSLQASSAPQSGAPSNPLAAQQAARSSEVGVAPEPRAAQISKLDIYNSEQADEHFRHIDQVAISVAREDQQTFTDLVHHLSRNCINEIDKVRAIFRWITVKNLNTMQFDTNVKPDTPLGLLRGIKNGSESYHVLFKRLCSYAGLHCVVIKGYSKSAGYQPGLKFEGSRFRNSWNAVFVAGAWRFVQCNWGARHLVSVAVMQDNNNNKQSGDTASAHIRRPLKGSAFSASSGASSYYSASSGASSGCSVGVAGAASSSAGSSGSASPATSPRLATSGSASRHAHSLGDSLRYEYDDHYFLTDAEEFIYEFFPLAPEWQLLKSKPISLAQFEQLPFVRSLFFKYGLYFPQPDIRSVLHADSSGAATVKIGMPTHLVQSLIFHFNLKHYDSEREHHDGVSLKRFVMQSVECGCLADSTDTEQGLLANVVSFRVHLPEPGAYILDIFANSITPTQYITGEPMKFKSVCKFKIVAKTLKTVMIPLPDCASGEFGPMKATRLFGLIPLSHDTGLISVHTNTTGEQLAHKPCVLDVQFRMTRQLMDFMATLHKNGHDERQLSKSVKIYVDGDIVTMTIKFHEDGQYGLDVYTRDIAFKSAVEQVHQSPTSKLVRQPAISSQQPATATSATKKQLLTHCCKYLINVKSVDGANIPQPNVTVK